MARLDDLVAAYGDVVALPWASGRSALERTWFVVYDPTDERRLRHRLPEFEMATAEAGHEWYPIDLTTAFAEWLAAHDYRESYFEEPELIQTPLASKFIANVAERIRTATAELDDPANTVLVLVGLGSLYGLVLVSQVLAEVGGAIPGRLAVFFPGEFEGNNYRLLGARDGWDYHAVPILAKGSYL